MISDLHIFVKIALIVKLYLSRLKAMTPHDKVAAKDEYNVRKNKSKLSEHRPFHSIWDTISEI